MAGEVSRRKRIRVNARSELKAHLGRLKDMPNLMPTEITNAVRQVLSSASRGKGNRPNFLTAYQILDRLPAPIKERLITERNSAERELALAMPPRAWSRCR